MIFIRSIFYIFFLFISIEPQIYAAQKIQIVSPSRNDGWKKGNEYEIAWTYNDLIGEVVVEYSHTGSAPWMLIAEEQIVSQSVYYFLPNDFPDSDNRITLRVRSKSNTRIQDKVIISIGQTQISKTNKVVFIDKELDNIRAGPSTNYNILAKCRRGESYPYLGAKDGWFMILYNGEVAYTHSSNGRVAKAGTGYTPSVSTSGPDYGLWSCIIIIALLLSLSTD